MILHQQFFVITGGPGAGKTTLLNALASRGYKTVPEVARQIIRQQVLKNGTALPWKDRLLYAQLLLAASVDSYKTTAEAHIRQPEPFVFFDRGIPDSIGYLHLTQIRVEQALYEEAKNYRYNRMVFILPPWKAIYQKDAERKQDWEEAAATYYTLKETYEQSGYRIIDVPAGTIDSRVAFVLKEARTVPFQ